MDSRGREVLLRGVNVNALAEYWKGGRFRTVFPLARKDPARMAAIGWNAVRLLVSWSRIEPEPGPLRPRRTSKRVAATVRASEPASGIYTIVDLHQDAWGPSLAARPGEACAPPTLPALGWDGAPAWATLDGGAARCYPPGTRELSPAVRAAWQAFFTDAPGPGGVGIQTRYVRMLRRVARRFARSTAVAGFDLMNEPNAIGADQQAALSRLLRAGARADPRRRAARARAAPPRAVRALGAVVGVRKRRPARLPARPRRRLRAAHIHGRVHGRADRAARPSPSPARGPALRRGARARPGSGARIPTAPASPGDRYFLRHQALQDCVPRERHALDLARELRRPAQGRGDRRAGRVPEVWGEFEVNCRTNRVTRLRRALIGELTRGYVRAAPGRLLSARYSPGPALVGASGARRGRDGPLVAFLPALTGGRGRRHGPVPARQVRNGAGLPAHPHAGAAGPAAGARRPARRRYVVAAPKGGAWALSVRSRR